jgi:hypothetical protein
MFDAEAAVTLLNNWIRPAYVGEGDTYLDILREGNLAFTHERSVIGTTQTGDISTCLAESLYFGDGSCALRVTCPHSASGWTPWTALHPLGPSQLQ